MTAPSRDAVLAAADAIEGTQAEALLTGQPYRSFCTASDGLEAAGIWNHDGETTELGWYVREEAFLRLKIRRAGEVEA